MTFCRACRDRECPPGERILPHMDVWLCPECIPIAKWVVYFEEEITNKKYAPWTTSQTDSLREYQRSLSYLPLVCDKNHVLRTQSTGLHCPLCNAPVPRRPRKPLRSMHAERKRET